MIGKVFRKVMRYDRITITDTVGYGGKSINIVSCDRSSVNALRYEKCTIYVHFYRHHGIMTFLSKYFN